jgi:hypothetical protein
LQNLTDLTEEDGSVNSKVQGFCERGFEHSYAIRAGICDQHTVINSCCMNWLCSAHSCVSFIV